MTPRPPSSSGSRATERHGAPGAEPSSAAPSAREAIAAHLRRNGLKHSRQRDVVVDAFLRSTGHVSVDELTVRVRQRNPQIGHTTVYRTMKLLTECGVASARHFGDGQTRYEPERPGGHHDHLVCEACGAVQEFEDEEMEELQLAIARRHGFALEGHTFEIHGRCSRCGSARRDGRRAR